MELTKAIINGSVAAAKIALSLLSLPRLISLTPPWTIALETENLRQHGEAKVAENVLISAVGVGASKSYISDNVAPGPYTWHLDGYIPGNTLLEPSNLFTPVVRMNTALLREAFKLGTILTFKDSDNNIYPNVVIQSLDIDTRAECKNKQPFSMVLKEINVLSGVFGDVVQNAATITAGSAGGEATKVGSTVATEMATYSVLAPTASYGTAALASTVQQTGSTTTHVTKAVESAYLVSWPEVDIQENFYFDCVTTFGTFGFTFKWKDGRWMCWVTIPDGETRQIGIYPNAISGTGFLQYGFDLRTDRAEIGYNDLFKTELYIYKWQA